MNNKSNNRIFGMKFANVYPLYVQKAERKNRTKEEVDQIILWLTGYSQVGLQQQIKCKIRSISSTDSGACRPLIPEHAVH